MLPVGSKDPTSRTRLNHELAQGPKHKRVPRLVAKPGNQIENHKAAPHLGPQKPNAFLDKKQEPFRINSAPVRAESDEEGGEGSADRGAMRRTTLERDERLNSLASDPGASAASATLGFVGRPGQRRSTRRIRPTVAKQDMFASASGR